MPRIPLQQAASGGHSEVVRLLLEHGANIEAGIRRIPSSTSSILWPFGSRQVATGARSRRRGRIEDTTHRSSTGSIWWSFGARQVPAAEWSRRQC
jgi:ankyrin repeat protein